MRILHLSDTHSQHRSLPNLPSADVIIHSGDMCSMGTPEEFSDFYHWFCALNYPCKIFIAGNHDDILHKMDEEKLQSYLPENMVYLYNSGVEIEGVKFWGMPFMIVDDNYPKELAKIPSDIDVLITHNPPLGILSVSENIDYGCLDLLQKVLEIKPKYHLFGHVHDAYGITSSEHTTFINAAILDEQYIIKNQPVEITM